MEQCAVDVGRNGEARQRVEQAGSLEELCSLLNGKAANLPLPDYFSLPTFGGVPVRRRGVWSWDATHLLLLEDDGFGFPRFVVRARQDVLEAGRVA